MIAQSPLCHSVDATEVSSVNWVTLTRQHRVELAHMWWKSISQY